MPAASILGDLDWLSAEEILERLRILASQPASAHRDHELAFLSLGAQRPADAARYAESAFASDPHNAYAAYACAITRIAARAWDRALEALLKIPVDFERAGEVAALCGVALLELGRYADAERICAQIGEVDDETFATLCGVRGRAAAMLGKPNAAQALLDRALAYDPKLAWGRTVRASLPSSAAAPSVPTVVI